MQFGDITLLPVPKPVVTTTPTVTNTPATNTPAKTGGFWDTINKILETGNKAVDVVQNVTGGAGSGGYQSPNVPTDIPGSNNGAPLPTTSGISLQKVALVGGGLAAVAGIVYVITRKKKSK